MQDLEITARVLAAMGGPLHGIATYDGIADVHIVSTHLPPDEDHSYKLFFVEGDLEAVRSELRAHDDLLEYYVTPLTDEEFYPLPPNGNHRLHRRTHRLPRGTRGPTRRDCGPVDDVRDFQQLPAAVSCGLTRRQHGALSLATDAGYNEVPRESSLAGVADRLDRSESTASTLLRRPESQVVERYVVG